MEQLLGRRANMVWRSGRKVRRAKHRAMRCCWCGVVCVGGCVLDHIKEEKVHVAKLARLLDRSWMLLLRRLWR